MPGKLTTFSGDVYHPGTDWTSAPPDVPGAPIAVRACFPPWDTTGVPI